MRNREDLLAELVEVYGTLMAYNFFDAFVDISYRGNHKNEF
jgi:hypothetical protein